MTTPILCNVGDCCLNLNIGVTATLPSKSTSPTDIWVLGMLRSKNIDTTAPLVMKLSLAPDHLRLGDFYTSKMRKWQMDLDSALHGLDFERRAYVVATKIRNTGRSPHVVRHILNCSHITGRALLTSANSTAVKNFQRNLLFLMYPSLCTRTRPSFAAPVNAETSCTLPMMLPLENLWSKRKVVLLEGLPDPRELPFAFSITEAASGFVEDSVSFAPGTDLETYLTQLNKDPDMWPHWDQTFMRCMFELFWTLRELHLEGILHYDLHWGNAMVDQATHEDGVRRQYVDRDGTVYYVRSDVIVRMFDWDRGTMQTVENPNSSMPGEYVPMYDVMKTFLCIAHTMVRTHSKGYHSLEPLYATFFQTDTYKDLILGTILKTKAEYIFNEYDLYEPVFTDEMRPIDALVRYFGSPFQTKMECDRTYKAGGIVQPEVEGNGNTPSTVFKTMKAVMVAFGVKKPTDIPAGTRVFYQKRGRGRVYSKW